MFAFYFHLSVNPGPLERAIAQPPVSDNQLLPGCVIEELVLEVSSHIVIILPHG